MNEFTRDELEEILYCVHFTHGDADGLADKIQTKIDGYCDHEETIEDSAMVKVCVKCHRSL